MLFIYKSFSYYCYNRHNQRLDALMQHSFEPDWFHFFSALIIVPRKALAQKRKYSIGEKTGEDGREDGGGWQTLSTVR